SNLKPQTSNLKPQTSNLPTGKLCAASVTAVFGLRGTVCEFRANQTEPISPKLPIASFVDIHPNSRNTQIAPNFSKFAACVGILCDNQE
ncbi:MAG: hypothetical protein WEA31_10460, partial [Pirellulales bacterium]